MKHDENGRYCSAEKIDVYTYIYIYIYTYIYIYIYIQYCFDSNQFFRYQQNDQNIFNETLLNLCMFKTIC